ncbi:hypothetical protein BGZ54_004169 [Gamsiella multidivaricata]|nr:hypothetical protein BGZ54_004169 [Gamsiella multidivaricata]
MSVAIIYKGELIFAEGFGKRNERDPFTVETLSQLGSITKSFTAAAVGELVAEGKMDWDTTPLCKYLPDFELRDPVLTSQLTMVDFLSHRTNLPDVDLAWFRNTEPRRDLIKRLKYAEVDSKLGTLVHYNNAGYAIAGEAAANVANISYERLVEDRIIKPLGLSNTGFSPMEMKKHPNYAVPYTAATFEDAQRGLFKQLPLDPIYMSQAPAGDMYSNVLDLVRYGQAIMHYGAVDGKQVLNKSSVTELLSGYNISFRRKRIPEFAPSLVYGLGWDLDTYKGQAIYSHGGLINGFRANLILFPDSELVVAHLANSYIADLMVYFPYYVADELLGLPKTLDWINDAAMRDAQWRYDILAAQIKGDFPERIKNKPPTRSLSEFVGEYSSPLYGNVSIQLDKGGKGREKVLRFKMHSFNSEMEHYHYDSFSMVLDDYNAISAAFLTFTTGGDGKVAGFRVNFGEQWGIQEFMRKQAS